MSLMLKGIDLPKEGEQHRIIVRHNGQVILCREVCYEKGEAIQIPKGHGDIKDVSRLYPTRIDKLEYGGSDGRQLLSRRIEVYRKEDIENAPTILESEGTNEYHIERD